MLHDHLGRMQKGAFFAWANKGICDVRHVRREGWCSFGGVVRSAVAPKRLQKFEGAFAIYAPLSRRLIGILRERAVGWCAIRL